METKYVPEMQMKRRICNECGSSIFEFGEMGKRPYFCDKHKEN
jgi:hypothetical protein